MKKNGSRTLTKQAKIWWVLKQTLQNCFPYASMYILIVLVTTQLQLAVSYLNKEVINQLTRDMQTGALSSAFMWQAAVYLAVYFLEKTSGYLGVFGMNFFRSSVDGYFRKLFMQRCSTLPQEQFFRPEFMDRFNLVGQHIDNIFGYINKLCSLLFYSLGYAAGMLVLFAVYEPLLIPYACLAAVVSFRLHQYGSENGYGLDRKQIRSQRREGYFIELLTGREAAKELRICGLSGYLTEKWKEVYGQLRQERLDLALERTKMWNHQSRIWSCIRIPGVLFLIAGLMEGKYDLGTFIMLFDLVGHCGGRVEGLMFNGVQGAFQDTKYIEDYYDFIHPVAEEEKA